jgi:hypothetical protein
VQPLDRTGDVGPFLGGGQISQYISNFSQFASNTRGTVTKSLGHFQRDPLDIIVKVHRHIAYGLALKTRLTDKPD